MSTQVSFRWTDTQVDPQTVFTAESLTVETRSRTRNKWDVVVTEDLTADQETSLQIALEDADANDILFTPTQVPKQKRARRIIASGQTVVGVSSAVNLATFTRRPGETVWYTIFTSEKTVAYAIDQTAGSVPTDESVRLVLRKTTTADQMRLRASNGLEAVTIDWVIFGVEP